MRAQSGCEGPRSVATPKRHRCGWKFHTGECFFFSSFLSPLFHDYFSPLKEKKINKETLVLLWLLWLCLGTRAKLAWPGRRGGTQGAGGPGTDQRHPPPATPQTSPAHPGSKSRGGARRAPEPRARLLEPGTKRGAAAGSGARRPAAWRRRGRRLPADGDRGPRSRGSGLGGRAARTAASRRCPPPAAPAGAAVPPASPGLRLLSAETTPKAQLPPGPLLPAALARSAAFSSPLALLLRARLLAPNPALIWRLRPSGSASLDSGLSPWGEARACKAAPGAVHRGADAWLRSAGDGEAAGAQPREGGGGGLRASPGLGSPGRPDWAEAAEDGRF